MKKSFVIAFALTTGLLSASAAQANDAVLGAVIGGGLGAVVGNHVSGRDGATLETSLTDYLRDRPLTLSRVAPSLEDAFIDLMQGSQDQFQG